jgi:16S rRNA (guanine527-N7)-methyltransferase
MIRADARGAPYTPRVSTEIDVSVEGSWIEETASALGLALDRRAVDGLVGFARLFLAWNRRINLGGDISARELTARHFMDAFAVTRFLESARNVVDVGSGGGLPAIPLALARSDVRVHLFEPTAKKVSFLRTAVRELGLKDRVDVRAERVGAGGLPAGVVADVAMSRATWAPAEWLALGRRLIQPDGVVLVFGTGGSGDPAERPFGEWRYAAGRRLLAYRASESVRST